VQNENKLDGLGKSLSFMSLKIFEERKSNYKEKKYIKVMHPLPKNITHRTMALCRNGLMYVYLSVHKKTEIDIYNRKFYDPT